MLRWITLLVCVGVGVAVFVNGLPTIPTMAGSKPAPELLVVDPIPVDPPAPVAATEQKDPPPLLTRPQASMRMQEALVAAGWGVHPIPSESLESDDTDHRALRTWRYLIEDGPHILIDADSGALLYLEAFCFVDEGEWIRNRPEPRISVDRALGIVETLTAGQYSAFSPRAFRCKRTRSLDKWPVWDLDFEEVTGPRNFANTISVMVEWEMGRVMEYVASNIAAAYTGAVEAETGRTVALGHWSWLHERIGASGVILELECNVKIDLDETRTPYPSWHVRIRAGCDHEGHSDRHNVLVNGATGEMIGWGGVGH